MNNNIINELRKRIWNSPFYATTAEPKSRWRLLWYRPSSSWYISIFALTWPPSQTHIMPRLGGAAQSTQKYFKRQTISVSFSWPSRSVKCLLPKAQARELSSPRVTQKERFRPPCYSEGTLPSALLFRRNASVRLVIQKERFRPPCYSEGTLPSALLFRRNASVRLVIQKERFRPLYSDRRVSGKMNREPNRLERRLTERRKCKHCEYVPHGQRMSARSHAHHRSEGCQRRSRRLQGNGGGFRGQPQAMLSRRSVKTVVFTRTRFRIGPVSALMAQIRKTQLTPTTAYGATSSHKTTATMTMCSVTVISRSM